MMNLIKIVAVFYLVALVCVNGQKLPDLKVDHNNIIVAGISSGAAMAVQFHVAHSKIVNGIAIIGGPPYWCANDNVAIALYNCMVAPNLISLAELYGAVLFAESTLSIDSTSYLKGDKVWALIAENDTVVVPGVMQKTVGFYEHYVGAQNIKAVSVNAQHAWITDNWGSPCQFLGEPYINNCNIDSAGDSLKWILNGKVNPRTQNITGKIMPFEQKYYTVVPPSVISMANIGYLYVPASCQNTANSCQLIIFFHGCKMSQKDDPDAYFRHTGYDNWADTNNFVILFPQISDTVINPQGCWDWWAYTGVDYATKLGPQIIAIKNMIDSL